MSYMKKLTNHSAASWRPPHRVTRGKSIKKKRPEKMFLTTCSSEPLFPHRIKVNPVKLCLPAVVLAKVGVPCGATCERLYCGELAFAALKGTAFSVEFSLLGSSG
jgi:hypothetical protein